MRRFGGRCSRWRYIRVYLLRRISRRHRSCLLDPGVRFIVPFSLISARVNYKNWSRLGGSLGRLRSCGGTRYRDIAFRFERQCKQRKMICLSTHLEQVRMLCNRQVQPNRFTLLQPIVLNCKGARSPGMILPLCFGQFKTYLDGYREDNLRKSSSFQILKLHINYLGTAPCGIVCSWI
jgi:hypothetical protein